MVDCADPDCFGESCPELCSGGLDEDGDGQTDCGDDDCACGEDCTLPGDDDGDGFADCGDPDCVLHEACVGDLCAAPISVSGDASVEVDMRLLTDASVGSCGGGVGVDAVLAISLDETSDLHIRTDTGDDETSTLLYMRAGDCETGVEQACSERVAPGHAWSRLELAALPPGVYYAFAELDPTATPQTMTVHVVIRPTDDSVPPATTADPLIRLPGTQPNAVTLDAPGNCLSCHDDYDPAVNIGTLWRGSMMSQAARDPLFWAAMTVAMQDSYWALGNANAADLCERCHFPQGWLDGRSDPPNASALAGSDYDGVHCDVCHQQVDPFALDTFAGLRPNNDWEGYWDETNLSDTPSQAAATAALTEDTSVLSGHRLFDGSPAFSTDGHPVAAEYSEATAAQLYVSGAKAKRAPFADANAKHPMVYSRFHKSPEVCATCHDVSNPVLANLEASGRSPGDGGGPLPSEALPGYALGHIERTFSEFRLSAFGGPGGAAGTGAFAPELFDTSRAGDTIAACQDCHMADSIGAGCNKKGVAIRPTESIEHPKSGQPLHDLTGGNVFISRVLASAVLASPNYDATNRALLTNAVGLQTLDLTFGLGIDADALLAGAARALVNLQIAASIQDASYDASSGSMTLKVVNHTGHKLISGFPEGRRMWLNVQLWQGDSLMYELNPYSEEAATLKGLDPHMAPDSPALAPSEEHHDALVYEARMESALTGEAHSFHVALATGRAKDNRIPPRGFDLAGAAARKVQARWQGEDAPNWFSAEEAAGGYDQVTLSLPTGATRATIRLYYQTTSREYVSFLRDQINGDAVTLTSPTLAGGARAYRIQTDPFFSGLRLWGDTIWDLWWHNRAVPGAAPVLMTEVTLAP